MEKKRKALYGVAAADAGQQLNVYIPELSNTGRQFLCHVCEQQLLHVCKGVKDMEQQKKEVNCLLLQHNAHLCSNSYYASRMISIHNNVGVVLIATNYRTPVPVGVKTKLLYYCSPDPFSQVEGWATRDYTKSWLHLICGYAGEITNCILCKG